MICLNKKNKEILQWINNVGEKETYRQFIIHNYQLPTYSSFIKANSYQGLNSIERAKLLKKFLKLDSYLIKDIKDLNLDNNALAAFFKNAFYFADSVNKLQINEEAFHAIMQTIVSPESRKELLKVGEQLLNKRVAKNGLSKQSIIDNYKKLTNLKSEKLNEYIFEEELAKEFVNYATYDSILEADAYVDSFTFTEKLKNLLKDFYQAIKNLINNYNKNKVELNHFFSDIKEGHYSLEAPQFENDYIVPSFSPITYLSGAREVIMDTYIQNEQYSRVLGIMHQLKEENLTDNDVLLTENELLKLSLGIYINPNNDFKTNEDFQEALEEEDSVNYENALSDVRKLYYKTNTALDELIDIADSLQEEVGKSFQETQSDSSNQIERYNSLSQQVKQIIYNIPVRNNETAVENIQYKDRILSLTPYRMADPIKIYASVVRATTNSDTNLERVKRLFIMSNDTQLNPDTAAFVKYIKEKIFGDKDPLKLLEDNLNDDGVILDKNLYQTIFKAFDLWNRPNLIMKLDGQGASFFNPNETSVRNITLSKWSANFEALYPIKKNEEEVRQLQGQKFSDALQKIQNTTLDIADVTQEKIELDFKALKDVHAALGIELSNNYLKYLHTQILIKNEVKEEVIPQDYLDIYNSFSLPTLVLNNDKDSYKKELVTYLNHIIKEAKSNVVNPFEQEVEGEKDNSLFSIWKQLAIHNSVFDESVIPPTFLNAEKKNIYAHQLKTYSLYFNNSILKSKDKYRSFVQEVNGIANNNIITKNRLRDFYGGLSDRERNKFQFLSYAGAEITKKSGIDKKVNKIKPLEFLEFQLNLVANKSTRKSFLTKLTIDGKDVKKIHTTVPYFSGFAETSNTRTFFEGIWNHKYEDPTTSKNTNILHDVKNTLNDSGYELIKEPIINQINRVKAVQEFLNDYLVENKPDEAGFLKITESNLRTSASGKYKTVDIYDSYHTGEVFVNKDGTINYAKSNLKDIPRGLLLTSALNGYVTDEIRNTVYENLNSTTKEIDALIKKDVKKSFDIYLNTALKELNKISENGKKNLIAKNDDLGFIEDNFEYNAKLFLINSTINRENYHRILTGDSALINKNDLYDFSKRYKGAEGQVASIYSEIINKDKGILRTNKTSTYVQMTVDKVLSGNTAELMDHNDAQSYISSDHKRYILHGLGKLTNDYVRILDKIQNGFTFTEAEEDYIKNKKLYVNIEKTRAFGHSVDLKTSAKMMTKGETALRFERDKSIIDSVQKQIVVNYTLTEEGGKPTSYFITPFKGETVEKSATKEYTVDFNVTKYGTLEEAIEADDYQIYEFVAKSDYLNKMRLLLEGWREINGVFTYTGETIDVISPITAHKREKKNIWSFGSPFYKYHEQKMSNHYYGRQVENPAGKDKITDPSQQTEIIVNNITKTISIDDEEFQIDEILKNYQNLLVDRDNYTVSVATKELMDKEENPYLKYFYKKVQENLIGTGGDRQLVEFFSTYKDTGNIKINPNLPIVRNKLENQIFAHFTKGVKKQKRKGDAKALYSEKGLGVLKKLRKEIVDGKIHYVWDVIQSNTEGYNDLYLEAKKENNFVLYKPEGDKAAVGLTYNGYINKAELNTLNTKLEEIYVEGEDVYFIDELRHNVPEIYNGKIVGYFTEAIMNKSNSKQGFIQRAFQFINGVRIPSQNKSTSVNLKWVDVLNVYEGNSITVAKEVMELAGSDFDIDKLFISEYEGYFDGKTFVKYKDKYQDFVKYIFKENKHFKGLLKEKYLGKYFDEAIFNASKTLDQRRKELDDFLEESEINVKREQLKLELKEISFLEKDSEEYKLYLETLNDDYYSVRKIQSTYTYLQKFSAETLAAVQEENNYKNTKSKVSNREWKIIKLALNKLDLFATLEKKYTSEIEKELLDFETVESEYNDILDLNSQDLISLLKSSRKLKTTLKELSAKKKDLFQTVLWERAEKNTLVEDKLEFYNAVKDSILFDNNLPNTEADYIEQGFTYAGFLNNQLLDHQLQLLHIEESDYSELTSVDPLKYIDKNNTLGLFSEKDFKEKEGIPYHSPSFDLLYNKRLDSASSGIGVAVNTNLTWLVLERIKASLTIPFKVKLTETGEVTELKKFGAITLLDAKINNWISVLITATTDEGKEGVLSKYNLQNDNLKFFSAALAVGIDPEISIALLNTNFVKNLGEFDLEDIQKLINKDYEGFSDPVLVVETLGKNYKEKLTKQHEYSILKTLEKGLQIYEQNTSLVSLMRLKSGFGAESSDFNKLIQNVKKLGLEFLNEDFYGRSYLPKIHSSERHYSYDLRSLKDEDGWNQIKNDIANTIPNVHKVLEKILLKTNKNYLSLTNSIFGEEYNEELDKVVEAGLIGHYYKGLSSEVLVGDNTIVKQLKTFLQENPELKNSTLFKKLRLKEIYDNRARTIKRNNSKVTQKELDNQLGSDIADIIELNIFTKLTDEQQALLMDDYLAIQNKSPEAKELLNKLFEYYLVKDSMFYSPISISKIFPTFMFKDIGDMYDTFMESDFTKEAALEMQQNIALKVGMDYKSRDYLQELKNDKDFPFVKALNNDNVRTLTIPKDSKKYDNFINNSNITGDELLIKFAGNTYFKYKDEGQQKFYIKLPLLGSEQFYSAITDKSVSFTPVETSEYIQKMKDWISQQNNIEDVANIFNKINNRIIFTPNQLTYIKNNKPTIQEKYNQHIWVRDSKKNNAYVYISDENNVFLNNSKLENFETIELIEVAKSENVNSVNKWIERNPFNRNIIKSEVNGNDLYYITNDVGNKLTIEPNIEVEVKGEEISSNSKGLAAALTNPTELSKSKGNLTQSYPVTIDNKTYKDAEEAFQNLKDLKEAKTKPTINNSNNYKLMVDIIVAKLEEYPRLLTEITKKGGSSWVLNSTHQPTTKNTVWETKGNNWFIIALNEAYNKSINNNIINNKVEINTPTVLTEDSKYSETTSRNDLFDPEVTGATKNGKCPPTK